MALCKCEFCGKPFNSVGTKLCAECMQQVDNAYVTVRKYIYQNSGKADFASITENTEISEMELNYLIDQGRVVIENGAGRGARCRACGAVTGSGTLCERCRNKLISEKLMPGSVPADKADQKAGGWRTQPLHTKKP